MMNRRILTAGLLGVSVLGSSELVATLSDGRSNVVGYGICLTESDVLAHAHRSREGTSLTCNESVRALRMAGSGPVR